MALTAKQQAGWMFTAANAIFALSSCGATYLAIEPKAGPVVAIIGAAFVLVVSGAGRASGAFFAEGAWKAGIFFFAILSVSVFVDYTTNDMGLKEVALSAEEQRAKSNSDIQAARDAIAFATAEIDRLNNFRDRVNSPDPEIVKQAQIDLKDLNLYHGPIDADKGKGTQQAMAAWSSANSFVENIAMHSATIQKNTGLAAEQPNNEASFFTVRMAELLAYIISGGSLLCSFVGGQLCSTTNQKSVLEEINAAREALERKEREMADAEAKKAEKVAQIQSAIKDRKAALAQRFSA